MAQVNQESETKDERSGDEAFSSDEWTIIDDKESNDSISSSNNEENTNNNIKINDSVEYNITAEEAREAIQVLGEKIWSENSETEESQIIESHTSLVDARAVKDDDSDGISVITESERNDDSFYKCITEIIKPADNTIFLSGTFVHIIIACLLAAVIGFGIGCYVSPGKTPVSTNDVNFKRTESLKFLNDVNKLNAESRISPKSKPRLVPVKPKAISDEIHTPRVTMNDLKNVFSLREILENVKVFLDALCTMIADRKSYPTSIDFACNHSSLYNLLDLKDNVENMITLTGITEENFNKRFIEDMESRIKNISLSFFEDLSKSIKGSVTKVDRKLSKIKHKLYQRVCLIENTMGDDPKIMDILINKNYFGANCTKRPVKQGFDIKVATKYEKAKFHKPERVYSHPVGPEVTREVDEKRDVETKSERMESRDYHNRKENWRYENKDKEFKKKYKQPKEKEQLNGEKYDNYDYKDSKEDEKWKSADKKDDQWKSVVKKDDHWKSTIKKDDHWKSGDKMNAKLIQDTSRLKFDKFKADTKKFDDTRNYEKFCRSESCANHRNRDRKYSQENKNDNWQFKRSEGRNNWRSEIKINDETAISWDYNRAKARETARTKH